MAVIRLPPLTQDIKVDASSLDRAIAKAARFKAAMDRALEVDSKTFTKRLGKIDEAVDDSAKSARKASRDFTELQRAYDETGKSASRSSGAINDIADGMRNTRREVADATNEVEEFEDSVEDASQSASTLSQRLRETSDETDSFSKRLKTSKNDVDSHGNALSGLTARLRGLKLAFLGVGITAIVPAIAQLVPLAAGLGAMIAPAAGLAAVLPGLGLGLAGVAGVLVAGLKGNEAVKDSFSDLGTRLSYIQDQIQERITPSFQGLFDAIGDGSSYIAASARVISFGIAGAVREFETLFRSQAFLTDFTDTFQGFGELIPTIGSSLRNIVSAFTSLSAASLPVIGQIVEGFSDATQRFSAFIEVSRNSGQLGEFLQNAYDVTKRLFGILGDAGGALKNLGTLANASGLTETLFGGIERGMESFREFTQLSNGPVLDAFKNVSRTADALGPIFSTLGVAILDTFSNVDLVPILDAIASAIPPVARGISNLVGFMSDLVTAVAPIVGTIGAGFGRFMDKIGPSVDGFVQAVGRAVPGVQDFIDTLFDIASDVGPPVIDFLTTIVDTFTVLQPAINGVATVVGAVASAFGALPGPLTTAITALAAFKLLSGSLGGAGAAGAAGGSAGGFLSGLRNSFSTAATGIGVAAISMRDSYKTVADATARTFSMNGGERTIINTGTAIGGLGAAAKTAASGGVTALKSAGSGLFGALGGPWGLAIGAGIAGISAFSTAAANSSKQIDGARDAGEALLATYRELGTVFGQSASNAQQTAIEQAGLTDAFDTSGVAANIQTRALRGNADAQRQVIQALEDQRAQDYSEKLFGSPRALIDRLTGSYYTNVDAANELFDVVGQEEISRFSLLSDVVSTAGTALDQYKEDATGVFGASSIATQSVGDITIAMRELQGASGDAAGQIDAVTRILQGLTPQVATSNTVLAETTTTVAGIAASFQGLDDAAVDAGGSIDVTTEAGANLYTGLQNQAAGYQSVIANTYAAVEATDGAAAASEAAAGKSQELRDAFIEAARGAGISQEAANVYADELGLIPGEVLTSFLQPGMSPSQQAADILRGKVIAVPDSKTIITSALTGPSISALESLGFKVETLPDGTVRVTADTSSAESSLNALTSRPRNISVNVTYAATNGIKGAGGSVPLNHDGAIRSPGNVQMFASGGFSAANKMRANWASIVPPKTWRVVGDRSQDNEAFIPINSSKRSQAILRKTAGEMGYGLVKGYADGGVAERPSLSAFRPTLNIPAPLIERNTRTDVALPSSLGVVVNIGGTPLDAYIDARIELQTRSSNIASGRALTNNTR